MAISKIHSIKSTLRKAIDYIVNPLKTILADGTQLVSSFGCAMETADVEFTLTSNLAKKMIGDYTKTGGADVLAYHLIQSFDSKEKLTPEQCHELGKEFAEKFLKGKHEYVIATHIDKGHLHNHIIFNSTSFVDYKKFRSEPWKTVAKIREVSDLVCQEHGLSVLPAIGVGKSYKEWLINKEGKLTWKDTIRIAIDDAVAKASNWNEFVAEMTSAGIEIKDGKHIAFRCMNSDQERFIRGKRIGEDYTKDSIIRRISDKIVSVQIPFVIDKSYIYKSLTDGFLVVVPNQNKYVYFNGSAAQLIEDRLIIDTSDKEFTIFNSDLTSQGKITLSQLRNCYDMHITTPAEHIPQTDAIPLSEHLRTRRKTNKELLHKTAEAVAYCRTQGVIYYRDFSVKFKELKDLEYDTRHTLIRLDKTVADIKEVGKLLVTYRKYLPIKQEAESKGRFSRSKFESKYRLELASFEYAERTLRKMGIDPDSISVDDLVSDIRTQTTIIREWESKADNISERMDKLASAQSTIDEFLSDGTGSIEHDIGRASDKHKNDINL